MKTAKFPPLLKDTYRAKGLRRKLVQTLEKKGIRDQRILMAFQEVPRHFFMDSAFLDQAYQDKAFPIGSDQTISQPYTVAAQTELLQPKDTNRVLEIGTGSGYQAAILSLLVAEVHTIERFANLSQQAEAVIQALDMRNVFFYTGDGTLGLPEHAPFDRILVTAGLPEIPQGLIDQLCIGGLLVAPVGDTQLQRMVRVTRTANDDAYFEEFSHFSFVPAVGKQGWPGQRR
jgi:protein-L-isoaspartate(D-aspartate) O-methyltransferase